MTVPSEANCYCGAQPRGGGGGVFLGHICGGMLPKPMKL